MPSHTEQMLIDRHALVPHPEGGWYREVLRSATPVLSPDGRERPSLTSIYFLLDSESISRWHVVSSDELWVLLEGRSLALHTYNPLSMDYAVTMLNDANRQHAVPAGVWQAAMPADGYALCACAVAPGFDFADFRMLGKSQEDTELLKMMGDENALAGRFV